LGKIAVIFKILYSYRKNKKKRLTIWTEARKLSVRTRNKTEKIFKMTVTEIAKLAGVSIGTVDRVIHNRGRVSEETRKKIETIIEESGYQPNALARHLKMKKSYQIGVLIPGINSEGGYWKYLFDSIEQTAAEEFGAFSFTVVLFEFERSDRISLTSQFNRMINSDCSAYIIAPVMQEEAMVLLSDIRISKPYCFIDTAIPGTNPLCTVTQDPYKAGYLAGRMTELTAREKGIFAVLNPYHREAYNLSERSRGFCDWFKGRAEAITITAHNDSKKCMYEALSTLFGQYENIAGICTVCSETHYTADFIQERQNKDRIAVTGFDLVAENRKQLGEGMIDCLISQKPEEQGRLVLQQLYRHLVLEENTIKDLKIPLYIYLKENLD
jgi:LacI family transcriptional regulator